MNTYASVNDELAEKIADKITEKLGKHLNGFEMRMSNVEIGLDSRVGYMFDPIIIFQADVAIELPTSTILKMAFKGGSNGKTSSTSC